MTHMTNKTDALTSKKWLAVPAGGDTVRLVETEGHGVDFFVKLNDWQTLADENERLRAALVKYGVHDKECAWPEHECDCGYSAIRPSDETRADSKSVALAQEICERHTRVNKLLWGVGAAPGTMLGPMDSDAAHQDRGLLLSMLTPEQRGTLKANPCSCGHDGPVGPGHQGNCRQYRERAAQQHEGGQHG